MQSSFSFVRAWCKRAEGLGWAGLQAVVVQLECPVDAAGDRGTAGLHICERAATSIAI
jgi:hypothetical protein